MEWRKVSGFDGIYEVSNTGEVRSCFSGQWRTMKPHRTKGGYEDICLGVGANKKWLMVHRLVAMAFIPNPEGKTYVNHKDFNRLNNRAENLEWVTATENHRHSDRAGRYPRDTAHKNTKLPQSEVEKLMIIAQREEYSQSVLARMFGLSRSRVGAIIRGDRTNGGLGRKYRAFVHVKRACRPQTSCHAGSNLPQLASNHRI